MSRNGWTEGHCAAEHKQTNIPWLRYQLTVGRMIYVSIGTKLSHRRAIRHLAMVSHSNHGRIINSKLPLL